MPNVRRRIVRFLYVEQPKSAELLLSLVGLMYAFLIFTNQHSSSPLLIQLYHIAPPSFWMTCFGGYFILTFVGAIFDKRGIRKAGCLLGIGLWIFLSAFLYLKFPITPATGIYAIFVLFSLWSYISIQEGARLEEMYGVESHFAMVNYLLDKQMKDLQNRVSKAKTTDEATAVAETHVEKAINDERNDKLPI